MTIYDKYKMILTAKPSKGRDEALIKTRTQIAVQENLIKKIK
jgi:hypothetical protein